MDLLPAIAAAIGGIGLLIGSFLNVVIYRVPRHESLLFPSSHCPTCDAPIKARHNVPVFAWLMLRGKCASCRAPISARYPLVELGTGVLFAAMTLRLGVSAYLPAYLFLAAIGVALAMIDVDDQPVPNSIVVPAYLIGIALLLPASATDGWRHLATSAAGAAALILVYVSVAMSSQRVVEAGHVLLAGLVGFYTGWMSWVVVVVAAAAALTLGLLARSALTTTGRRIGMSSLPIGMLVLASGAFAVLAPLPI